MSQFKDPFIVTVTPDLCNGYCTPCLTPSSLEDCFICGYPTGIFPVPTQPTQPTPCLDGSVNCLDCESSFANLDVKFLGGFVSGFSSRLGFGASESTVNIDIVIPKSKCPNPTTYYMGACCFPDGTCGHITQDQCDDADGDFYPGVGCDPNPCCSGCNEINTTYEGKLGYIYTFNMGSFCFKGILSTHNYNEDNSGYKYRITLTDGRNILSNAALLMNGSYSKLPQEFSYSAINVASTEDSVSLNECGNGKQCKDFMLTASGSSRGVKIKIALQAINGKCLSVPVSGAGLKVNVTKLINVVSDELRTTNTESSILELITLAANESGYDFFVKINNNNELEIEPVNYKKPATDKSLFSFVENLSATDIVISKDYGEEMASSNSNKNKRIVFGSNLSYITRVRDLSFQRSCDAMTLLPADGICCQNNLPNLELTSNNRDYCIAASGVWYPHADISYDINDINGFSIYPYTEICGLEPPCSIYNNPASIGAYDALYITPTPLPSGATC